MGNKDQEQNLFHEYSSGSEPSSFPLDPTDNPKDQALLSMLRDNREEHLSPYAFHSKDARGRRFPEEPCTIRSDFERDTGRIIYSQAFRRLRHKTQVFFNPQNDHICSRIEHVIYVNYVATTIARALNLNLDLVQAIALGHDIGHSPFGHSGEKTLHACVKKHDPSLFFQHEMQSLRVADVLAVRNGRKGEGLNLSFEVRDGIVSHCGETYSECNLSPNRNKPTDLILKQHPGVHPMPATLEGCVVRIADKIAYVGRDIEDAARAGILDFEDIPPAITSTLGATNSQIIHTLVTDIIHNSLNQDAINLSAEAGSAMEELLKQNASRIYQSEKIRTYETRAQTTVEGLFGALLSAMTDPQKAKASGNPIFSSLADYAEAYPEQGTSNVQIVTDYIAGMTDSYANKCYESIYWV
jgi:dGTPase